MSFNNIKPTLLELVLWKRNKIINPRTKRKITEKGRIYNILSNEYRDYYREDVDPLDSVDDRDPISLELFWKIENKKKILVYKNLSNLVVYLDSERKCRCLEKSSLEYLKAYKMFNHPITNEKIPFRVFKNIKSASLDENCTLDQKALSVFQLFTKISIFIDHELFLKLDSRDLDKLYYETQDFYYKNLDIKNRIIIDKSNGNKIFSLSCKNFNLKSKEFKFHYILDNMKLLLDCQDEAIKYMINYIIIGGLGLVIPQIRTNYPDFSFSF